MTGEPTFSGRSPRGWFSRGYLPHFDAPNVIQSVTIRLADSLPQHVLTRMHHNANDLDPDERHAALRLRIEAWNDEGHGCCVLRKPQAAQLVQDALIFHDGQRYHLLGWAIMPNHVHILVQSRDDWSIQRIIGTWKSWTGRRLAPIMPPDALSLGFGRRVWQMGYWDRYIRNHGHYQAVLHYIRQNPVKAGLAPRPEAWPWSSADYDAAHGQEAPHGSARL